MKWMLIAVIFGTTPVKTDLLFDSLSDCLKVEDSIRAEHVKNFNDWVSWAQQNRDKSGYPNSQDFQMHRIGLKNLYTCIPHKH